MANFQPQAAQIAKKHGVPPDLFLRLIGAESGWNPNARSPVGAIGLGQLMPGTARGLGVDPNDPIQNLEGAARYLAQQLKTFGDPKLALAAYNAGPGAVRKYGGIPPYKETQAYVAKIMAGQSPQQAAAAIAPQSESVVQTGVEMQPQADRRDAILRATSPTDSTLSILEKLGGMAARTAQSSRRPIVNSSVAEFAGMEDLMPPPREPMMGPGSISGQGPAMPAGGFVAPLATPMTGSSEFGIEDAEGAPSKGGKRYHAGKDWFAPAGAAVVSPWSGEIIEVKGSRGNSGQVFGGTVKVRAANGQVFVARHVDPQGIKVGQEVSAGVPIATVSDWRSGNPHAHIEIWKTAKGGYRFENMLDPAAVFGNRSNRGGK